MDHKQLRTFLLPVAIFFFCLQNAAADFSQFSAPQNMGPNINSADMDQTPAMSPNGLSLYFTSSRAAGGQGGNDIWVSQRQTTAVPWGPAINIGTTVNTSSNDTVSAISSDGLEMLLTSNRAGGSGGPDLYIARRTDPNNDFSWTAPFNLGPAVNSTLQDVGLAFFVDLPTDARSIYFWSERSEPGLGNIYQSVYDPNSTNYLTPTLVSEFNTASSERGLTISRDGLEAFISSTRLSSTSVFSVFVSRRASISSPWNPPLPVALLNNGGNASQPSLSPDGTVLYFVSSRTGTAGAGDLYSATRVAVNRGETADFDGDGRSDLSIFRPSTGTWWILQSGSNTLTNRQFGLNGDRVVPGDYDGDARTDLAIFRPSTGLWWIENSSTSLISIINWGLTDDKPVPGDYDGDGRTDIAVYRDGVWYIIQSSSGGVAYQHFGLSTDIPIAAGVQ